MNKDQLEHQEPGNKISAHLEDLEQRLAKIEEMLDYRYGTTLSQRTREQLAGSGNQEKIKLGSEAMETRFGEQVFSWISSILVLFTVVFIMTFLKSQDKDLLAIGLGYLSTGAVLLVTFLLRKTFPQQIFKLRISVHILLYYITLQLHYLGEDQWIKGEIPGLILTILPIIYMGFFAIRKNSEALSSLVLLMLVSTAIIADLTPVTLSLLVITAAVGLFLGISRKWYNLMYFSLFAVYLSHLVWVMNNPIMGNPFQPVENPQSNLLFLFSYGFIYSSVALAKKKRSLNDATINALSIWNALLFSLVLLWEINLFYQDNYMTIFAPIAVFSLLYSVVLQLQGHKMFITAFYAVVSFVSISVLIYGLTGLPDAFFWLAMQSFLVVSIALWYRSPLIIVANLVMFLSLFVFYLVKGDYFNGSNIAFALVALATARLLNLKKERLTLKTEHIRNIYLLAAFFGVLFSLYHLVPDQLISASWLAAAAFFFGLSFVLKNQKYRWLAFGTLFTTVLYLIFFDLKNMELGYRILAFLVIAIITLISSFYYSKRKNG